MVNALNGFLGKYKRYRKVIESVVLLLLLMGAVYHIAIPLPGTSKKFAFYLTEIAIFGFVTISLVYRIRQGLNITDKRELIYQEDKLLVRLILMFMLYVMLTTIYRTIRMGFNPEYLNYPRVSAVLIAMYFLLSKKVKNNTSRFIAVMLFMTISNLLQFLHIVEGNDLRQSTIAVNINIFVCACLVSLPLQFQAVFTLKEHPLLRLWSVVLIIVELVLVVLSGSRAGFVLFAVGIGAVGVITLRRENWRMRVVFLLIPLISAALVTGLLLLEDNKSPTGKWVRYSVYRATMLDKILGERSNDIIYIEKTPEVVGENATIGKPAEAPHSDMEHKEKSTEAAGQPDAPTPSVSGNAEVDISGVSSSAGPDETVTPTKETTENSQLEQAYKSTEVPAVSLGQPVIESENKPDNSVDTSISSPQSEQLASDSSKQYEIVENGSDFVRKEMWLNAISQVKSNILFGSGTLTYHSRMGSRIVRQSAHNLLLEMLMSYGAVGSILYLSILARMLVLILVNKNSVQGKAILLLATLLYVAYSFFQPTFVSIYLIVLFMTVISTDLDHLRLEQTSGKYDEWSGLTE